MGFILSCSTTPARIGYLIKIIPQLRINYKFFIINVCCKYKRFGKFKIPKDLLKLCLKNKKVVFQFIDDYGPLCKYIGGYTFLKKKKLYNDKLIIIDDDTFYHKDLFYELMDSKSKDNITTGSGFNFKKDRNYNIVEGTCEMVEGYAGICFDYEQYSSFLFWYSKFYNHFSFKSDNIIDEFLSASFLGDDFIISDLYKMKIAIKNGRKYLKPQSYGFNDDALHRNNSFGSNMGSYNFLYENIKILNTFKLKYELNKEIILKLECKN